MGLKKVGALWKPRDGVSKSVACSGLFRDQRVIVFHNTRKTDDKHPDFNICIEVEQEDESKREGENLPY